MSSNQWQTSANHATLTVNALGLSSEMFTKLHKVLCIHVILSAVSAGHQPQPGLDTYFFPPTEDESQKAVIKMSSVGGIGGVNLFLYNQE